ncbi:hypothetical protein [Brevibacillus sp. Leaf182]|uniref:hypothetical protein n=1 Tax=Brevibacillus sp. Leaf182 TaxID=1736290 RepID=UPI0006FB8BD9|nr:hypothetical protein [Brevibacillus sp. Leaf182]RAT94353.1 hypothetical protein ASG16_029715 [Brevibacillus sp. Leaf182]
MVKWKAILFYYFIIISLVFFSGRFYIMGTHSMEKGPVAPEAFQILFNWVTIFSYFYIVPLIVIGLISLIRFFNRKGLSQILIAVLSILYIPFATMAGYVLMFVFILLFYGFAP